MSDATANRNCAAPSLGDEIHLPGPSLIPVLNAVGARAGDRNGITDVLGFRERRRRDSVPGDARCGWIRDVRRDFDELPLEHGHH